MKEDTFTMADGRDVGVAEHGDPNGTPLIWCHGGPGCRREPSIFAGDAARLGLRIIGIDRPGYGRSTPQPGRTIGGWVRDALTVADRLEVETFITVGVSTGGAYALALAASTPRVRGAVACCAVSDMRWAEGRAMVPGTELVWNAPSRDAARAAATEQFGARGEKSVVLSDVTALAPSDTRLFARPEWARHWSELVPEMFAQGVVGYTDDRIADGTGWHTFDVSRIVCPVVVLHGTADTLVPVAHARYTQSLVPGATLELRADLGHFSILPEVLPALSSLLAGIAAGSRQREARRER